MAVLREKITNLLNKPDRGLFIVFEGGEGAGKSTQLLKLAKSFFDVKIPAYFTREPGGTLHGEKIRELIVRNDVGSLQAGTELLLHMAARFEHIETIILPKLANGEHVICDRFYYSTIAYQAYGHGLPLKLIQEAHELFFAKLMPDFSIILNIPPKIGVDRAFLRKDEETRYEQMAANFHDRVNLAYTQIANDNSDKCLLINADDTIDNIHQQVIIGLNQRFNFGLKSFK